ncbi:hypothetical protein NW752_011541 [Fusarium irregulare]|nr:hypothetical protein NW752_011541 [Fusarium irregulare]
MKLSSIISFWVAALFSFALGAEVVPRSTLKEVTNFGNNPTGTRMFLYVPKNLKPNPAVVVALHYCTGTAQGYMQGGKWHTNAEKYGYIVIYPQTPYTPGNCWDVSSKMTLTHEGGGSSTSIANMAKFVLKEYNGDSKRVFVTGESSGAMMTNVMAATYPDLFAAGIAYAGVPASCFKSQANQPAAWNSECSQGKMIKTQQQWAQIVKDMYPGYNGARPKMQIYHGTADSTLNVQNYYETIKQWSGIFGYSSTPTSTTQNFPRSPFKREIFGDKLQGFLGNGQGHGVEHFPDEDLKWFGLAPTILLVPGAFLGPNPYATVAQALRDHNYVVDVVDTPSAADLSTESVSSPKWKDLAAQTVESDVKAIHDDCERHFEQGNDVVLIGHSYGSIPAMLSIQGQTVKERKDRNLAGGIVGYLNMVGFAFAVRGKNAMASDEDPPFMPYHEFQDGVVTLQESAKPLFFSDLTPEKQDEVWSTFPKQQSWACFLHKADFIDTDITIPKAYIRTGLDQCIAPAWQDGIIAAGGYETVLHMETGHCPMVSAPEQMARVVGEFVNSLSDK